LLLHILLKLYAKRYYDSIDEMPIYNWFKWHEEKDEKYLARNKNGGYLATYFANRIFDQYIERFGFSETFIAALEKQKELTLLKVRKAITEDNSINTFIKICEIEIETMNGFNVDRSDFYEIKSMLENKMGFAININKVSVAEYYTYFKALKNITPKNNG